MLRWKCQAMDRRNSVAPDPDGRDAGHPREEEEDAPRPGEEDAAGSRAEVESSDGAQAEPEADRPRVSIRENVDAVIRSLVARTEANIEQKHPVQFSQEAIRDAERRESMRRDSIRKDHVIDIDEPSTTHRLSGSNGMNVNASFASKSSAKSVDKGTNTSVCDKCSVISVVCRICYDETIDEPVISPCNCKGTVGLVHKSCLERWLAESNTDRCDLCHKQFTTERKTKYTVGKSLCVWLRYRSSQFAFPIRDLKGDIISCSVLSPIALGLIYICLLSADYYNQTEFAMVPAAQWTSLSVMMMGLIMLIGFFIWIYLVIRYHSRVWYFWWQRETIVEVYLKPD